MAQVPKFTNRRSVPGTTGMQNVPLSLASSPLTGIGEGITTVSKELDAAGQRIQNREDVIRRGRDGKAFQKALSSEWQRVQDEEDLTDGQTVARFNDFGAKLRADYLAAHTGSANSSALFDSSTTGILGQYEQSIIGASRTAQIKDLSKQFGDHATGILTQVANGSMDVPEAFLAVQGFSVGEHTPGGALPINTNLALVDALQSQIILTSINLDLKAGNEAGLARAEAKLDENPSFANILGSAQLGKLYTRINDQKTAINEAANQELIAQQNYASRLGFSSYSDVPAYLQIEFATGREATPPKPYEMQTDAGRTQADRAYLLRMAGGDESDPAVAAFDAEVRGAAQTPLNSPLGKLIRDKDSLEAQGVPSDDPRVLALQASINAENPDYVAQQDRIQKFAPAVAAFETFNRQAVTLEADAKKALMLITGTKTYLDAKNAVVNKEFSTWTSGTGSFYGQLKPGSVRKELEVILTRIGGKAMLDGLATLKASSPNGSSSLGALNQTEGDALRFQEGGLDASAPQTTSQTLINLIDGTNSVIDSQIKAFRAAFPTLGKDIVAIYPSNKDGDTGGGDTGGGDTGAGEGDVEDFDLNGDPLAQVNQEPTADEIADLLNTPVDMGPVVPVGN